MHAILTSHGSTGDIYPMIGLGVALQNAGHQASFATSPPFRAEIEAAGLNYLQIPPLWSQANLAYWMGVLQSHSTPLMQLRALYRAARPHISSLIDEMDRHLQTADALISSYLFPMNRALAERHGLPFATFAFAHNTVPSRYHPPEGLPRLRFMPGPIQQSWNRTCWRLGNLLVDTVINQTIARELKARGLPQVRDFFSKPADLVLLGVSKGLMHPPFKLNPRFRFVGYSRWQASHSGKLESEILAFTRGGKVPILTFGSMVYDRPGRWMGRLVNNWPSERKLIIQEGWGRLKPPPGHPNLFSIGPCSHDQLFSHASVVIHHGGAGTTASVLHAGRPHIVVPHIADQHFFSGEVKRLGVGHRIRKSRWPELLHQTVQQIEQDPSLAERVADARRILQNEDGPGEAVREIEAFVARQSSGDSPAASRRFFAST
ncbi:MAG: glycosyltransferase [Opitutaceae bacterium]